MPCNVAGILCLHACEPVTSASIRTISCIEQVFVARNQGVGMTQHRRGEHPGIVVVPDLQLEDLVRSRNNRVLAKFPLNAGDLRRRNSETCP